MNVLFIGGGRRVSLAELFKKNGFDIFSYELNSSIPISINSTIISGKSWSDPDIENDLINKISNYEINLIIPLQDEAVVICARLKNKILNNNIIFLCTNSDSSEICFNKKKFESFMVNNFPKLYPLASHEYPKFSKPIFGYSSKDLNTIYSFEQEQKVDLNKFLIQKKVFGKEYSVDAYFDFNSNFVDAVVRERIRVAGGEVITSLTIFDEKLYKITSEIGEKLKLKGPTCFQFIVENDKPFILEINARFGGGSILSIEAGMDIIKLIKKDYFNFDFKYIRNSWKKNLLMERYYKETFFELK